MTKEEIKSLMFTKVYGFNVVDKVKHKGELIAYREDSVFKFGLKLDEGYRCSFTEIERIPEKKIIPWTPETAPFPLALREKYWRKHSYMLFEIVEDIIRSCSTSEEGEPLFILTFDDLAKPDSEWEQRDGSPCGVEVEV